MADRDTALIRELLLILGHGFIPTLGSVEQMRWTHPALPGSVETTETASDLCKRGGSRG